MRLAPYRLSDRVVVEGFEPDFEARLYALLTDPRLQHRVTIASGVRTYAQQLDLYRRWRAGTYNVRVVARPGTSRHETGRAADLDIGWHAPFGWDHVHAVAADHGLHFNVPGEAWHVETDPNAAPHTPTPPQRKTRMFQWTCVGANYLWTGAHVITLHGLEGPSYVLAMTTAAPNVGDLDVDSHYRLLRRLIRDPQEGNAFWG